MHEGESSGSENTIALPNENGDVAGALGASENLEAITTVVESLGSIIQDLQLTTVLDDSPPNHVSYCYGSEPHSCLVLSSRAEYISALPLSWLMCVTKLYSASAAPWTSMR